MPSLASQKDLQLIGALTNHEPWCKTSGNMNGLMLYVVVREAPPAGGMI